MSRRERRPGLWKTGRTAAMEGDHVRKAPFLTAIVAVVAMVLGGCTPGSTPPPTDPPSSPPSNGQEGDLRTRLARALQPVSPDTATLVEDGRTTLTEVPAEWLDGWLLIDVLHYGANHPRRVYVALSDTDEVQLLTGRPDAFNAVVRGSEPTADTAADVARTFLDTTRDFRKWSYRVEQVGDIKWLPKPTAAQAEARDKLIKELGSRITAPRPVADGDAWSVTLWTVTGTSLVQHDLTVRGDGTVEDTAVVAVTDLPVPDSM